MCCLWDGDVGGVGMSVDTRTILHMAHIYIWLTLTPWLSFNPCLIVITSSPARKMPSKNKDKLCYSR